MKPEPMSENARRVLEARYLLRDGRGELVETPEGMFRRVACAVAAVEPSSPDAWEERFFAMLCRRDFLPNSPTLMNAGTPVGQLSACFVLPVEDSIDGIFDSLRLMALIQQSGGGTGFSFSRLRPRGDRVRTTGGEASGPVSFMRLFDCATENIRQGGRRRGANMGVLRVDHPDILEFIDAKVDGSAFANFNLSVGATDAFMQAVAGGGTWTLRHPRTGDPAATVPARELFDRIASAAWRCGDPGIVFLDRINEGNPTPGLGAIEATNPCGEVPLLPYEACNLGSINLAHMARSDGGGAPTIDWDRLGATARLAVRFLDDVIDAGRWPDARITERVRGNRKIGLGVMGFAELLVLLGIPYASTAACRVAGDLMRFVAAEARAASEGLAGERGPFPNWKGSLPSARGEAPRRNATLLSIAPTGTISILADTSSGIEPLFALAYRRRHVLGEETLVEWNPLFARRAREAGFDSDALREHVGSHGTLAGAPGVPASAAALFRTALEIVPEDHLAVQAAFQRHVDNAVSKTINLPEPATDADVGAIFRRAWELRLKGITIYRYGSRNRQVLELGAGESPEEHEHFSRCDPHSCRL